MATTLIDTRKSIMAQIHTSWNKFRQTKEASLFLYGELHHVSNLPLAKDFSEKDAPWSSKQTVLERNAVHANKLIRLYIALNIDVAYRVPIWKFFEIQSGVVGRIKDEIKVLKRVQTVLKLEQELELHEPLPNATSLFTHTGTLSLDEIEKDFKVKVKEAKKLAAKVAKAEAKAAKALAAAQDKARAKAKKLAAKVAKAEVKAAKEAKKLEAKEAKKLAAAQAKAANVKAKKDQKFFLDVVKQVEKNSIAAEKLGNKLAKKTIALLKWAQAHDFELEDIVNILESEIEAARSDNNMVTIIDIA